MILDWQKILLNLTAKSISTNSPKIVFKEEQLLNIIREHNDPEQALMIALYIAMDSFGTACNVTGDGAIALIINKIYGKKK